VIASESFCSGEDLLKKIKKRETINNQWIKLKELNFKYAWNIEATFVIMYHIFRGHNKLTALKCLERDQARKLTILHQHLIS
jgi:hypothetical protein